MRIIKYFSCSYQNQSLIGIFRRHSIYRSVALIIFLFLCLTVFRLFLYTTLIKPLNLYYFSSSNVIVSLTSTPLRFNYELPITIHSLLTQTKLPKQIRIYLSPTNKIIKYSNLTLNHLKIYLKHIDSSIFISKLFDKLVQIYFEEEDYGPATKFLPVIKESHSLSTTILNSQQIIICDDDHYYHSETIATLMKYSKEYTNSIIGLRGWRIREDLIWGVSGQKEIFYHIIESFRLSNVYRVGIVTANHAYLIRPSFFDSHIYLDFNQVSDNIRRVDDIWLNGYASKQNISRFVIPACCRSIHVVRTHELENYLISHQMTRSSANEHALKWFNQTWEKDLWYRFNGQNRPIYRRWWIKIYREWIDIILRLKFIIYLGFI
ncbi:unnamed protein product [Adineta steineri]|uniref:Glycosyltransferase 2-like domain-containing protein n=1 Tax=Adineta steineri TaxID=433720 RepID=A0A819PZP5_9BILA|nr:unnamed protein product [Adineta steineri]